MQRKLSVNFFECSIEGLLTRGGCIQGFVNRGFVVLAKSLGSLAGLVGLDSFPNQ